MDDRYDERYRRSQAGRSGEASGGGRGDARRERWGQDEWQPESGTPDWAGARQRQPLSPGQLSDGGPPRDDSSYEREYSHRRYPEHPAQRQGDDRRGSDLRYGLNGQYEPAEDDGWRQEERYNQRQREQDWLRDMDREPDRRREGTASTYERGYFSDMRGSHGGGQRTYRGGERNEEYAGLYRGGYGQRNPQREGYRGEAPEPGERGALYDFGRRIGEAVGEAFGQHEDHGESQRKGRRAGPKGYQRSDERIREAVCEQLAYARGVDVREVDVDVAAGVVTLSGTVRYRSEKFDIEDLADNVFGVTEVLNHIRVQREGAAGLGDAGSKAGTDIGAGMATPSAGASPAATPATTPAKMTDVKAWSPD